MRILSSKNLCYKLIVCLFSATFIFISIITVISFRIEMDYANNKAELMINQLIDTIEPTVSIAIYANNSQIAKEVLEGLLRNDVVHKVVITSYGDKDLFLEKMKGERAEDQKEVIREIHRPFGEKISIGQIRVVPEANFSLNAAKHTALINTINALILTGLTLLFMLLMIHYLFSKPLICISNTLRDIIVGEQYRIEPLENNKNDEIGRLITNINKILDLLNTKLSTQKTLRKHIESIEKKLRSIFQSTSAGLFLLDKDGNVLTCTPTLLKILGYQDTGLVSLNGQNFAALIFKEPTQFQQMMQNALESEQLESQDLMLQNDTKTNPLWVHCLLSKIVDTVGATRFEGVIFDISKRVANEKATQYEATHDPLTGLLRRNAAEQHLKKHLVSENNTATIVLILDLDGFKAVNDTYGHDAGDIVLIDVARRLESCVRHHDIICRLGGDEFLIILFDCSPINTGFRIAEQIIASIQMPVAISMQVAVDIGVSIGIALFPVHGSNVEELLKSADEAMYEVKHQGKNGYGIKKNGSIWVNQPYVKKRH